MYRNAVYALVFLSELFKGIGARYIRLKSLSVCVYMNIKNLNHHDNDAAAGSVAVAGFGGKDSGVLVNIYTGRFVGWGKLVFTHVCSVNLNTEAHTWDGALQFKF